MSNAVIQIERTAPVLSATTPSKTHSNAVVNRSLGRSPSFHDALAAESLRTEAKLGRRIDDSDPRNVRRAAQMMTSEMFYAPLLREARKAAQDMPFGGGRAEEVFGEQLDQRLADAVASGAHDGLTAQIEQKLGAQTRVGAANVTHANEDRDTNQ